MIGISENFPKIIHRAEIFKTRQTVTEIQNTTNIVFNAVNNLVDTSKYTLDYIETKVVHNYKESVTVGENYDKDATYINGMITELSATSQELLASTKVVAEAINQISQANNEGVEGMSEITNEVVKVKELANEVTSQVSYVKQSVDNLKGIVSRFSV